MTRPTTRGGALPLYVSYEEEYRDYRATHRSLEFEDLWRLASGYITRSIPEGPVEWLDFGCGAGGLLEFCRRRGSAEAARGAGPFA